MSDVTLSKTETRLLTEAAGREGAGLVLPDGMKPSTRARILGRLTRDGLILAVDNEGGHRLTPAGFQAVGLRPPRVRGPRGAEPAAPASEPEAGGAARPGTKKTLIQELLGRPEGASLAELIAATGWLPHTTRAALSRLRSAGQELTKSSREDGSTAYRIAAPEPKCRSRAPRKAAAPAEAAAT